MYVCYVLVYVVVALHVVSIYIVNGSSYWEFYVQSLKTKVGESLFFKYLTDLVALDLTESFQNCKYI